MNKKQLKQAENYLDYRWSIYLMYERDEDHLFYRGVFEAYEHIGCFVTRDKTGKHIVTKAVI